MLERIRGMFGIGEGAKKKRAEKEEVHPDNLEDLSHLVVDEPENENGETVAETRVEVLPAAAGDARDIAQAVGEQKAARMGEKYPHRLIAGGAEHWVYGLERKDQEREYPIPQYRSVVAKTDTLATQVIAALNAAAKYSHEEISPDASRVAHDILDVSRQRQRELVEGFGQKHVLPMRQELMQVPATAELLGDVSKWHPLDPTRMPETVWTITKLQRRAAEIADPKHFSAHAWHLEKCVGDSPEYRAMMADLVENRTGRQGETDLEAFYDPSSQPAAEFPKDGRAAGLFAMAVRARADEKLRVVAEDFVRRAMDFSAKNFPLDLAGQDNVTFYKEEDGEWNYHLVDVTPQDYFSPATLQVHKKPSIARAVDIAWALSEGKSVKGSDIAPLYNAAHFARTINALAEELGMKDRFDFVPEPLKGTIDWRKVFRSLGI